MAVGEVVLDGGDEGGTIDGATQKCEADFVELDSFERESDGRPYDGRDDSLEVAADEAERTGSLSSVGRSFAGDRKDELVGKCENRRKLHCLVRGSERLFLGVNLALAANLASAGLPKLQKSRGSAINLVNFGSRGAL